MGGLRIGVNALYLVPGGVGGTEIYIRRLLAALAQIDSANEYVVYANRETDEALAPAASNFRFEQLPIDAINRPKRLIYEQTRFAGVVRSHRLDVLFNAGFTAPFRVSCPQVTVFHDLQHKRHPEHFGRIDLLGWRFFLYWSARRSERIIAVSEATRRDLLAVYGLEPERVHTVAHGVEDEFFRIGAERGDPEPLILCVSTLHPHKNLDRLVKAFARFREWHPEYRLVLAGMRGLYTEALEKLIADLGLRHHIEVTGWIEREELYSYFRRAALFVYPSTFEGFGMPVLEAMAAGIPTVCSAIEPLRSIVGDAAVTFQPWDERALASALLLVAEDEELRATLAAAGPARAAGQTWESAAAGTLRVLEQAAREAR